MLLQGKVVRHAARRLPRALAVCGLRVEQGLAPLLLPLRRGCSGAVVFQLAHATAQALRDHPAELLRATLQVDVGQAPAYRAWRALRTAGHGVLWLTAHLQRPAWLVLVPEEGVAVYLWRDEAQPCATLMR